MEISVYHYKAHQTTKQDAIRVFKEWDFHESFTGWFNINLRHEYVVFNKKFKLLKYDGIPAYRIPEIVQMYENMMPAEGPLVVHELDLDD